MVRALAENGRYVMNIDISATGVKQIGVLWIDTPGEIWVNPQHRVDYSSAWQTLEPSFRTLDCHIGQLLTNYKK